MNFHGARVLFRTRDGGVPFQFSSSVIGRRVEVVLPENRTYDACIRLETSRVVVTGFIEGVEICTATFTVPTFSSSIAFVSQILSSDAQAYLVADDGDTFLRSAQSVPGRRTTILTGQLATVATSFGGAAFSPCLGPAQTPSPFSLPDVGRAVAATALDALLLGEPTLTTFVRPLLNVDIVLPPAAAASRIITTHEFGHTAFCRLLHEASRPEDWLYGFHMTQIYFWSIFGGAPPPVEAEAILMSEAFAEWFSFQLAGGGNRLVGAAGASTYPGDLGTRELYCFEPTGCIDANITGAEDSTFPYNNEVSRMASILHDIFDGTGPVGNVHAGVAWQSLPACPGGGFPACAPYPDVTGAPVVTADDDAITLLYNDMLLMLKVWLTTPFEQLVFTESTIMQGATRVMRDRGFSDAQICALYSAHHPLGGCPGDWTRP